MNKLTRECACRRRASSIYTMPSGNLASLAAQTPKPSWLMANATRFFNKLKPAKKGWLRCLTCSLHVWQHASNMLSAWCLCLSMSCTQCRAPSRQHCILLSFSTHHPAAVCSPLDARQPSGKTVLSLQHRLTHRRHMLCDSKPAL